MDRSVGFGGEALILTGPPGSGKTTVARMLAEEPGSAKVHIHSDDFWGYIKNGSIPPYLPESHSQNETVMSVLASAVEGYARGGYLVVLDGIIGPWFLSKFEPLSVPLHYVVLRPPLDVAIQRCRDRGGGSLTDPRPITDLHRQFSSLGSLERHVVGTEALDPVEMLQRVKEALASRAFLL